MLLRCELFSQSDSFVFAIRISISASGRMVFVFLISGVVKTKLPILLSWRIMSTLSIFEGSIESTEINFCLINNFNKNVKAFLPDRSTDFRKFMILVI